MRKILILASLAALPGCVSTAETIVSAPFNAAGKVVDWSTTSQDEADRNRGREMRKQEERDRKAAKKAEKERRKAARD
jgi:NADH:ubiquinone oxidoreductase subunit B-like Fe-S oxidoreductase